MTEPRRRAFLPVPDDYHDLTDEQQLAVCEQMAQTLITQLGENSTDSPQTWPAARDGTPAKGYDLKDQGVPSLAIGRATPGFSGADLANLINEAAIVAVRHDRSVIEAQDIDEAKRPDYPRAP